MWNQSSLVIKSVFTMKLMARKRSRPKFIQSSFVNFPIFFAGIKQAKPVYVDRKNQGCDQTDWLEIQFDARAKGIEAQESKRWRNSQKGDFWNRVKVTFIIENCVPNKMHARLKFWPIFLHLYVIIW